MDAANSQYLEIDVTEPVVGSDRNEVEAARKRRAAERGRQYYANRRANGTLRKSLKTGYAYESRSRALQEPLSESLAARCEWAKNLKRLRNNRITDPAEREELVRLAAELKRAGYYFNYIIKLTGIGDHLRPEVARMSVQMRKEQSMSQNQKDSKKVFLEAFRVNGTEEKEALEPTEVIDDEDQKFVIIMGRGNVLSKAMTSLKDFLK